MPKYFWGNILIYGILMLSVSSVVPWLMLPMDSFAIWSAFNALMIWAMLRSRDKTFHPFPIVIWMLLVITSSVVGVQFCRDYWDWKLLGSNVINYAICVAAFSVSEQGVMQSMLRMLYKHIWKIFILLALFLMTDGISKFMLPFSILALFYPLLSSKYRRMVWLALIITLIFGYGGRSDILKFLFCLAVGIFSLRHEIAKHIRKYFWILYILPFVLFLLALNGTFNIFQIGSELSEDDEIEGRISVKDTRTQLYEEVINTAIDRGTIKFGSTPARGYESNWMIQNQDLSDVMGDEHYGERADTESSVVNVFLHFGVFGIVIYLILFMSASVLGVFRSNNTYVPIIGLYVAFRFLMGWIEDFTRFDLNMFFLWSMIGICYSPRFREMTDEQFCEWLEGVLA